MVTAVQEIHAAVWDRVGLKKVQEFVCQWSRELEGKQGTTDQSPDLPLPPEHRSLSLSEKWAGLAALHDFYWMGDKINPWPLPDDGHDWEAWKRWLAEGWSFKRLLERVGRLADTDEPFIARWLKEAAGASPEEHGKEVEAVIPNNGKLAPSDLARKYGVSLAALRKRLDHWRYEHDSGYSEVRNPKRNESKFLYDETAVMPVVEALRVKSAGRKRATDGQ